MKAGRKLDALVAEKVMGWSNISEELGTSPDGRIYVEVPNYTTDIAAAWEVVDKLTLGTADDFNLRFSSFTSEWDVDYGSIYAASDTAPFAICFAALKAVGVTID